MIQQLTSHPASLGRAFWLDFSEEISSVKNFTISASPKDNIKIHTFISSEYHNLNHH